MAERESLFQYRPLRWVLTQVVVWTPFVIAFNLGAPWWIAYGGVFPSMLAPLWTVAE